ncbi:hypothetical protein K440DRAFT_400912 [Wilcoxina mikolae CBS 423.85]|nr:hypothetical protein K440DRAFT_400912 [Wilcoxina mikolae CBS 423.85]
MSFGFHLPLQARISKSLVPGQLDVRFAWRWREASGETLLAYISRVEWSFERRDFCLVSLSLILITWLGLMLK